MHGLDIMAMYACVTLCTYLVTQLICLGRSQVESRQERTTSIARILFFVFSIYFYSLSLFLSLVRLFIFTCTSLFRSQRNYRHRHSTYYKHVCRRHYPWNSIWYIYVAFQYPLPIDFNLYSTGTKTKILLSIYGNEPFFDLSAGPPPPLPSLHSNSGPLLDILPSLLTRYTIAIPPLGYQTFFCRMLCPGRGLLPLFLFCFYVVKHIDVWPLPSHLQPI